MPKTAIVMKLDENHSCHILEGEKKSCINWKHMVPNCVNQNNHKKQIPICKQGEQYRHWFSI